MDAEEHHRLIEWIAAQRDWLETVTTLDAVHRRGCDLMSEQI